jgi:transcriptional regulator with XRE-family HTH domain
MVTGGVVPDSTQPRRRTLADKLNFLFETVHPGQATPFSARHVAAAITADAAARGDAKYEITHSYISLLRSGERDNPTLKHLEALASFFGVPVGYFLAGDERASEIEDQIALLAALADSGVRDIAFRAAGLSAASLKTIAEVMRQVRRLEGLPADPDSTTQERREQ